MIVDAITQVVRWYVEASGAIMDWYLLNTNTILDMMHIGFDSTFKVFLLLTTIVSAVVLSIALLSKFYKYPQQKYRFIRSKAPRVSVHIPTRNELAAINCAKRALAFDYPQDKLEIIIGDDSDIPEVSAQLDAFAAQHKQVIIARRKKNVGFKPGNLNNMLKYTTGEIITVFDSDFLPKRDFLKRLVAPFIHDPKLAGTQARWKPINNSHSFTIVQGTQISDTFHFIFLPFMQWISGSVCLCGSAEAVRVSTLKKLGRWTPGAFTEDIEYSFRLYKNGYRVQYISDLECDMEVPTVPVDLYKQQMRWAYGIITAAKKHFVDIVKAPIHPGIKLNTFFICIGYTLSVLLVILAALGVLSFITHPPGAFNVAEFVIETLRNIAFTSGLLVTLLVSTIMSKRWKSFVRIIPSSFSVGLLVTLYVNKGIFRALTNKSMQWFLVKKEGNTLQ